MAIMLRSPEIEKFRQPRPSKTFREQISLIMKEKKKSRKNGKGPAQEIPMKTEKKGGHRLYLVGDTIIDGPNLFAEGKIPSNVIEI